MSIFSNNNHYNKILLNSFIFLLAIYILYLIKAPPPFFFLFSGLMATLLFGWIMYTEYRASVIRITPLLAVSIIPFFMLGISAIYKSYIFSYEDFEYLGPRQISSTSIVVGYLMVATGLVFQVLGILIFTPNKKKPFLPHLSKNELRLVRPFIFFLLLSQITGISLSLGILQNFLYQVPLAILIFISINDRDNLLTSYSYKRNFILIGSAVLFLFNITELSKTSLVYSIFPVVLFYALHSVKNKKTRIVAIVIFTSLSALYFLFVQPLVSNARLYAKIYKVEITPSILFDFIVSGEYKIALSTVDLENNPVEIFLNRMFEVNAPAFIYDITRDSDFLYGQSFESIAYGLVPRILWSEKPSVPQGQKFSELISGMTTVHVGMLIAGELYWNFGYLGIIIGSLIIGLLIGFLWSKVDKYLAVSYIYFTLFIYLLQACLGGSEFSAMFIGLVQLILIFYIIKFATKLLKGKNN